MARIDLPPICAYGATIITSRKRAAAAQLADDCDTVVVQPLDKKHALVLLQKKTGRHEDVAMAEGLAAALEYMPLAITQAAAYIKKGAPRCSIEQYLVTFEKSDSQGLVFCEFGRTPSRSRGEALDHTDVSDLV